MLILNLLILQEVDGEHAIINGAVLKEPDKVHETFLTEKTEGVFGVLIENHARKEDVFYGIGKNVYAVHMHWIQFINMCYGQSGKSGVVYNTRLSRAELE